MEYIIVSILNGVVHGLLLFMVSAGLTLIFGMMGVLNFAHAWFYMLGAYVGFTLTRLGGFWIGLTLAPIVAGFAGILVERYLLRRVHHYGHAHELLLTFGLAFIIEEVIKLFYLGGASYVSYQMPDYMQFRDFRLHHASRNGATHSIRAFSWAAWRSPVRHPLSAAHARPSRRLARAASGRPGRSSWRRTDATSAHGSSTCSRRRIGLGRA